MSRAARLVERHRGKEAMSFLATLPSAGLPPALRAEAAELTARAHQLTGDFRRARRAFEVCFRLARAARDHWRLAETALHLGDTSRQLEEFTTALRWYRLAALNARLARSERAALDASCGIAMSLRGLHKYDAALRTFARLAAAYRRRRDTEGAAYILWAMGTTERFAGRLQEAHRHLKNAVTAYQKIRDASGLAYARCGWGGTLRMMGHAAKSRRLYAEAYRTFRRENDRFGMAYSSCGQANGFRMAGQLRQALPFMSRAEKGYRALGLKGPLGFVLWSRAQLFIEQKRFTKAAAALRGARAAFRSSTDPRGLVYVELGLGELERAQGRPKSAHYRRAASSARRLRLALELAHANVRSGAQKLSIYRPLGVSIQHFSRYRSLP